MLNEEIFNEEKLIYAGGVILNNLNFNRNLVLQYKSNSQAIRVLTESWLSDNMYCPCCGNVVLKKFENNKPVADFYCEKCKEQFELKSSGKKIENKIVDGAYATAIDRVNSKTNPDLFVLQYSDYKVTDLVVVPKYFFTPDIIEKRKPLSETARRAGWIGSNILYGKIPLQGKIKIVTDGEIVSSDVVLTEYQQASRLYVDNVEKRGWLFDVLNCVNDIPDDIFSLKDIYVFEDALKNMHPQNNNVKEKIRQQLQLLRDREIIEFIDNRGHYRKIK